MVSATLSTAALAAGQSVSAQASQATGATGAAGSPPASTSPSAAKADATARPSPSLSRRQAPLAATADNLRTRFQRAGKGYAGVVIDEDRGTVTLYARGQLNSAQAGLLRQTRAAADRVAVKAVTVVAAPYSREQLERAQGLVWAHHGTYGLESVEVHEDGTGLTALTLRPTPDLADTLERLAGVPVKVEEGSWGHATRQNDSSPFYGGARIQSGCTTAFGMHNAAGTKYLATASHCGNVGDTMKNGNGSRTFGRITWDGASRGVDIALITSPSGASVYDGAWNNASGYSKVVDSWRRPVVGESECASGSYSGAVCGIKVVSLAVPVSLKGYTVYQDVAEQVNHTAAWGNGDSGGPVFGLTSGSAKDIAVGVIATFDTRSTYAAPCKGVPTSSVRKCAWRVGFARIGTLNGAIGVVVNEG